MQHVNVFSDRFSLLFIFYIAELWVRASMLRAKTLVRGKSCFQTVHEYCCLIPTAQRSDFGSLWGLEICKCGLWLFLPPLKWENAPLTQRGFVWTNEYWWIHTNILVARAGLKHCFFVCQGLSSATGRDQHVDLLLISWAPSSVCGEGGERPKVKKPHRILWLRLTQQRQTGGVKCTFLRYLLHLSQDAAVCFLAVLL